MKKKKPSPPPAPRPSPPRRWLWLAGAAFVLVAAVAAAGLWPGGEEVPEGMAWIPPGEFTMGSEEAMGIDKVPNSLPLRRVWVDGFWMDKHEVTNAQFAAFVRATGYKTVAERPPDPELRARALPQFRDIGAFSLVFTPPKECPAEQCTRQQHRGQG
jgi:formylglycine-generating enzyme required for sulfatase activity